MRDGFPVVSTDFTQDRPAHWHHATLDALAAESPFTFNDSTYGFWMIHGYEHVREALRTPEVFSNRVTGALGDPTRRTRLLPQNLGGREHMAYRHVLNPWFGPTQVERTAPLARRRAVEMIEELLPTGRCEMTGGFGMRYPTEIFLAHLGLPIEDGPWMVPLVESMFRGFFGGDPAETRETVSTLKDYFRERFAERETSPRDPATDFVTAMSQIELDGVPFPYEDRITMCFTIMLAGLDTTRSALGFIFEHLATHPDDRAWLVDDLDRLPLALEEMLRLYPLLIQDGRYVEQDVDFHGCPLRKGDVVWLGLATANRDPSVFADPDRFVRDRAANRHLAFGAGPHRCLGAHLARKELLIVLEEWLRRIPDFELEPGAELTERGGQLMLREVPLVW